MKFTRREVLIGSGSAIIVSCSPDLDFLEADEMASLSTPISLFASGTLQAGSVGGVNSDALVNPHGLPMEISEIKWSIRSDTNTIIGAGVGCSLELGDIKLTNGYVPINAFCKSILLRNNDGATSGALVSQSEDVGEETRSTVFFSNFVWRLRNPIFVPSGAVLTPKFQHRNMIPDTLTVNVAYGGRVLPLGYRPKRLVVPWVSYWASNALTYSAANSQSSLESDLVNPWSEPLYVQRFVGRTNFSGNLGTNPASDSSMVGGLAEMIAKYIRIRMAHSTGTAIIPNQTKFESVFYESKHAWEANVTIPPRSYFTVQLDKDADATATGATAALRYQAIIGMVGFRELGFNA